jgi:hypothetical protein
MRIGFDKPQWFKQSVVYLCAADKYRRLTHQLSRDQKGLQERVLMASHQLSHPW